jgi:GNAT superfamily N-acetyltransferase
MNVENDGYLISTDSERLDLAFLRRSLNATYWAHGRSQDVIEKSIRHSLCFGLYRKDTNEQIGFARVVTDQATFSWVCDVVVDDRYRGRGLGKWLMSCVVAHPQVKNTTSMLVTRDAHGLYERYGYRRHRSMRRPRDEAESERTRTV